tara:strand:- start:1646 stop:2251 length:606 start_codon:yes stop_codon:yes gene_type:complete
MNAVGSDALNGDIRTILPTLTAKYGVVIADPPWLYRCADTNGTADKEYDLLDDQAIYNLPVSDVALPDSVLLLWTTWPKLTEGMQTMEAWGFEYVTGLPWVKMRGKSFSYGVGHWVRGCSEPILIGRRGNVSPPRQEGFLGILSPNLGHSRKPESLHQIAEALPGPYLELFARRRRAGWTCIGNELDKQPLQLTLEGPTDE